ncbi:hypothetical protein Droror1_Dr00012527 [Drosera rotundifolia]
MLSCCCTVCSQDEIVRCTWVGNHKQSTFPYSVAKVEKLHRLFKKGTFSSLVPLSARNLKVIDVGSYRDQAKEFKMVDYLFENAKALKQLKLHIEGLSVVRWFSSTAKMTDDCLHLLCLARKDSAFV